MKMSGGPASLKLKLIILTIALLIAVGTLVYTQLLVSELQTRERKIVELYASSLEYVADPKATSADYTFLLDVIKRIDFPLILTDANNNVSLERLDGIRNLEIDTMLSIEERKDFINEKIKELEAINKPIPVVYEDSLILNKIFYGDSDIIQNLRYYPYLQILFALIFIAIFYVSFSYLKKTEQSNIWVGMSKETAHQLGTPISSLMGWSEILKLNYKNPTKVLDVSNEIDDDLLRLNKIAQRFSKIGSKPELKNKNVYNIINKVVEYFINRLPRTSDSVKFKVVGNNSITAPINSELFEWVIENLIKNALDAIKNKNGRISFNILETDSSVEIEIEDNGKGIDIRRRKDIFRPGYSTKRRGWGLGLSLSKRIIEDYHDGKIFVKNSIQNEGTVFQITLKR
ncbi:ATP-binding protein [Bacteroidota bacterium]